MINIPNLSNEAIVFITVCLERTTLQILRLSHKCKMCCYVISHFISRRLVLFISLSTYERPVFHPSIHPPGATALGEPWPPWQPVSLLPILRLLCPLSYLLCPQICYNIIHPSQTRSSFPSSYKQSSFHRAAPITKLKVKCSQNTQSGWRLLDETNTLFWRQNDRRSRGCRSIILSSLAFL